MRILASEFDENQAGNAIEVDILSDIKYKKEFMTKKAENLEKEQQEPEKPIELKSKSIEKKKDLN